MNIKKQNKNRSEKQSFNERMSRLFDVPGDLFCGMTLEMRGRNELLLCGCLEITEYSLERIRVVLNCGEVCVSGRRLTMASFTDGRISVCGEIDCVDFAGEEERKRNG